jgi:hypothetical protein
LPGCAPGSPRLTPDLARVAGAGDVDAHERALQRARHRGAERGLAGARRTDQAQRRARQVGLEPAHREILDDALLGLGQREMIALEHGLDALEIRILGRGALPRHGPQPLEVRAHVGRLGGARRQAAQAIHLALRLPRHLERQAAGGAVGGEVAARSLEPVRSRRRRNFGAHPGAGLPST